MSQAKVERNKEFKANRKSINRSKRIKNITANALVTLFVIFVVFWIGFSVYTKSNESDTSASSKAPIDVSALTDYLDGLSDTDTE